MSTLDPGELVAEDLASELSRVRQRSLAQIDHTIGDQGPIEIPLLEDLARRHAGDAAGNRVPLVEKLIRDALDAYELEAGQPTATFIRRLFFRTDDGQPPVGPGGPTALLRRAERDAGITDASDFAKVRRRYFAQFAEYLPGFVTRTTEGANPAPDEPRGRFGRLSAKAAALAVVVVALTVAVVLTVVLNHHHSPRHTATSPTRQLSSTAAPTPTPPRFRFDTLGSTYSSILNVYPGVKANTRDRTTNGTFHNGDTVRAVCVTTGRPVTSDPHYKETPRSSDQWVRIDALPDEVQYATLTYGDLIPALAKLPQCNHVS